MYNSCVYFEATNKHYKCKSALPGAITESRTNRSGGIPQYQADMLSSRIHDTIIDPSTIHLFCCCCCFFLAQWQETFCDIFSWWKRRSYFRAQTYLLVKNYTSPGAVTFAISAPALRERETSGTKATGALGHQTPPVSIPLGLVLSYILMQMCGTFYRIHALKRSSLFWIEISWRLDICSLGRQMTTLGYLTIISRKTK